jgi:hypothetical protein
MLKDSENEFRTMIGYNRDADVEPIGNQNHLTFCSRVERALEERVSPDVLHKINEEVRQATQNKEKINAPMKCVLFS